MRSHGAHRPRRLQRLERFFQTTREPRPPFPYAPAEAAAAVARAAEALGIGPAHLVLHDSALAAGAAFASANPGMVQSVTLIDTGAAAAPAFPAAVFRVPLLQELVLMVPPLFRGLLWMCCVRGIGAEAAREHRMVMMRKTQGVVEASRALNRSFDLGMWRSSSEEVRSLPMMVLWSRTWSERWRKEGKKVAALLPDAKFIYHSGSRWPQVRTTLHSHYGSSLWPLRSIMPCSLNCCAFTSFFFFDRSRLMDLHC